MSLLTEKEQPLHMGPLNYMAPSNTANFCQQLVSKYIYSLITTVDRVSLHQVELMHMV